MPADVASPVSRLRAAVQLVRPANIVTAWADIGAGVAASGLVGGLSGLAEPAAGETLAWLLIATTGLYGGGVVLNDVFDAALDARERPERPIPSGRVPQAVAAWLGGGLLLLGVGAAAQVSWLSGALAVGIAAGAVFYDAVGKHAGWWGAANMGACRGGNLLLGVSAVPAAVATLWPLGLIPVAYITAITAVSQGEVHGGRRRTGWGALGLMALVMSSALLLGFHARYAAGAALPFLVGLGAWVVPPFVRAARAPQPAPIRRAVKAGVVALILLDATLAAGFAGWAFGLVVAALLPLSLFLGRRFAVT